MDFILADEQTMEQMREEYEKKLHASLLGISESDETPQRYCPRICAECVYAVLSLYIIAVLSYNDAYGTQNFDTDRGMGRLRCKQGTFGSLNNIRYNNG